MQEAKLAKVKRPSSWNHQIVQKNHKAWSSVEKDYSPYIKFARGLAMVFNQSRAFAELTGQGSKLVSTSQFPFKKDSPVLAIVQGLVGMVNELKKGVKYLVQMLENAVDKNESGPEPEEWFYENTETSDTFEDVTEGRRKPTSSALAGATPRSIRHLKRKKKLEKARLEKLERRKLSKKKKRRKKKH